MKKEKKLCFKEKHISDLDFLKAYFFFVEAMLFGLVLENTDEADIRFSKRK